MPESTGKEQEKRDEKGRFKPGVSGNPQGRPAGALNFATEFKKALKKLANANNVKEEELELQILQMAIKKARDGDFNFYRDTMDRVYGKPVQRNEHSGPDGKPVEISLSDRASELLSKYDEPVSTTGKSMAEGLEGDTAGRAEGMGHTDTEAQA